MELTQHLIIARPKPPVLRDERPQRRDLASERLSLATTGIVDRPRPNFVVSAASVSELVA